ncbi:MAG: DNA internalization-related competence protein ComEC/Rec2 [Deltaproteobacteria bacterium]|nr:DNA internalization-related competence protein ComEC/Rec2 [Deltaproteobacteria bacterium]
MSIIVILVGSFVIGIAVGLVLPTPIWCAWVGLVGGLLLVLRAAVSGRVTALSFMAAFFLAGFVRSPDNPKQAVSTEPHLPRCTRLLQGRIVSPALQLDDRSRIAIDLDYMSSCLDGPGIDDLEPAGGRVFATIVGDGPVSVRRGDHVLLRADLKTIAAARNPGRPSRKTDRVVFTAVVKGSQAIARIAAGNRGLAYYFDLKREGLASFWRSVLDPKEAGLARALTLGESGVLGFDARERFRRTGTAHLLSVSGLHLGLAVLFVFWLLKNGLLYSSRLTERWEVGRIAAAVAIPIAVSFAFLAGGRTPVVRACVMVVCALAARMLGRASDTGPAIALAGAALLVADPRALFEPGFQLSFAAVLSFVIVLRMKRQESGISEEELLEGEEKEPTLRRVATHLGTAARDLLRSSVAAAAATTPLVLYHFGYVSWIAVLTNMVAVPITGMIILPGLLIVTALAGPAPYFAGILARPVGGALCLLDKFLGLVARIPCTIENPGPFLGAAVAAACVSALLLVAYRKRAGWLFTAAAAVLAALGALADPPPFPPGKLTVDILDVGQGDSILVTFPDGRHWLVDAGGAWGGRFDVGERIVVPSLRALGVKRLDKVVVTHPDFDHVGGLPAVLDAIEVGELWENGQGEAEGANDNYNASLEAAGMLGVTIRKTPGICGEHQIGGVNVVVVHPCGMAGSYDPVLSFNDNSIVMLLHHGLVTVALPGDIEQEAELQLIERGALGEVDVLKLPHHGSRTSTSPELLEVTSPWMGIASAGRLRRMPHREVIHRLDERKILLKRTDRDGAVRIVSDGRVVSVETISSTH